MLRQTPAANDREKYGRDDVVTAEYQRYMLNIGVIAHLKHAVREPFAGGLEMHTHHLCHALRTRGHRVTLFAAAGSELVGSVELCAAMHTVADSFRAEHEVYLKLMTMLGTSAFDVIHNNSLHYLPVTMAGTLPMPMITTLHTPPFWEMEGSMRLSHAPHHRYVAVSDGVRRSWQPIAAVDCTVANGIDLGRFVVCGSPDAEAYAIWSGRIVPEKGLHLAMDAARLTGLPLRFAGPISNRAYYEEEIVPRMTTGMRYLGHVGHDELAVAIGGARVFIFTPMWEEPYGLVVAEALACGTPVAAFARGAVPDLLTDSSGVTATAGDVPGLAAAIVAAQALDRRACRRRAEAVADARHMIDRYEALYIEAIRGQSRMVRPTSLPPRTNAASIIPTNASLINLYAQRVPVMVCPLPAAP